ncbi:unnamed protein product [Rotaria sordida]|uniref:BTB domain-containing protein n=1 Tax=Rotaria sordida TaxID=392033 RepID=A0A819HK59_9BILA|nr:unnamed protein product [Rotaria sordida]
MILIDSVKSFDESMREPNNESPIVVINVSGRRYETRLSTLENFPETLLGNESKRQRFWLNERNEYFFDRHRGCFESILHYYQSNGQLRRPDTISLDIFLEEVSFFQLGPKAYDQLKESENIHELKSPPMPKKHWPLRTVGTTIKEAFVDFIGVFAGIILLAFLFGAACYVAEVKDNRATFSSIPKSLYWGIITIMTIGYGDMYPITTAGRMIACGCALAGAAIIGMLVSVIVDHYQRAFNRKTLYNEKQRYSKTGTTIAPGRFQWKPYS